MYGLKFRGKYSEAVAKELDGLLSALKAWLSVDHNEDGTHNLRPSGFDFVPIGAMQMWGSATPPERWLICDGTPVSRTTYQGLFAVIGTTYGVGDGSTTFNIPDLRQRFPLGKAASGTGSTLGSTGGAIDHTHSGGSHTHSISSGGGGTTSSDGSHAHGVGPFGATGIAQGFGSEPPTAVLAHDGQTTFTTTSEGSHTHTLGTHDHGGSTGSGSGGTTGTGNPPYLVTHFIILAGV